jgi:3-phenylpropionate/trans-cinnamate dioxygenase ferredoxin subunit
VCPWHGWEFELSTGQSYWNPRSSIARRFPVELEDGDVVAERLAAGEAVPGPYVAEVYPVSLEDQYVVVTMRPAANRSASDAAT